MLKCTVILLLLVSVQQTESDSSKPHVYDPDILESLRLDMMYLESRVGEAVRSHSDRVVAAMAQQEAKLMTLQNMVMGLVNISATQVDVTPVMLALDKLIADMKVDVQQATRRAATEQGSVKAEPNLGYQDLGYWWSWWQATWNQPLSIFFIGFSLYQAENKLHKIVFFVMGFAYSPHLGGFALLVMLVRAGLAAWRKAKRAVQESYCGRCCCPRSAADDNQDAEMGAAGEPRLRSVRATEAAGPAILEPNTGNDSVFERSGAAPQGPLSFWAYARAALDPYSYLPLGARASVDSW
jgi:hypothetical protein